MAPKHVKISVPQDDGEISIAHNGDDPKTYKVTGGVASVPEDEAAAFLHHVDGAELADAKTEKTEAPAS